METSEQVKFWVDFGVSFGIIALALVTWASVYETQKALLGEDARFQYSLRPMVRMYAAFPGVRSALSPPNSTVANVWYVHDLGDYLLSIVNDGHGPARNICITFKFKTIKAYVVGTPDYVPVSEYDQSNRLLTSFLGSGKNLVFTITDVATNPKWRVESVSFGNIIITYEDSFGAKFTTEYPDFDADARNFKLSGGIAL